LVVAGLFTSAGGVAATNLAEWDGSKWLGLDGNPPAIYAMAVQAGKLYVGGNLKFMGGFPPSGRKVWSNNLAVWDGSTWSSIEGGPFTNESDSINMLAAQGNNLFVAGYGPYLNAQAGFSPRLAVWNGSTWSDSILTNTPIHCMAATAANLYVGGYFTNVAGVAVNNIARWDGVNWFPLGGGLDDVVSTLATDGTNVYAGGSFTTAGGKSSSHFAVWREP
jgi:hypothetical protein